MPHEKITLFIFVPITHFYICRFIHFLKINFIVIRNIFINKKKFKKYFKSIMMVYIFLFCLLLKCDNLTIKFIEMKTCTRLLENTMLNIEIQKTDLSIPNYHCFFISNRIVL